VYETLVGVTVAEVTSNAAPVALASLENDPEVSCVTVWNQDATAAHTFSVCIDAIRVQPE